MNPFDVLDSIPGGVPKPTTEILRRIWSVAVGETVSKRTEVLSVKGSTLTVAVDSNWEPAMAGMKRDLLRTLNSATPWTFERLELEPRTPQSIPEPELEVIPPTVPPSDRSVAALDGLDDPEIRALSERILKRVLKGD